MTQQPDLDKRVGCLIVAHSTSRTIRRTLPVRLLCTSDQPVAEATTYTTQNKHKRRTSMPLEDYSPQFLQSRSHRPTLQTARPPVSVMWIVHWFVIPNFFWFACVLKKVIHWYYLCHAIPVAARCEAWVYYSSVAGIAGSKPERGINICLLWLLCVFR